LDFNKNDVRLARTILWQTARSLFDKTRK